jgi:DedD protein
MEEKNELNDIILNKSTHNKNNKKLLLAVATLALILIIVVVIMNSLKSEGTDNLPQAVLPPEPITQNSNLHDDPLFEPVEVIEEESSDDMHLNEIAQKLKEESLLEDEPKVIVEEEVIVVEPEALTPPAKKVKTTIKKQVEVVATRPKPKPKKVVKKQQKQIAKDKLYVQVGSFTKFRPSSRLIKKIEAQGFTYTYHKVQINGKTINKVLIGPFDNKSEANSARKKIRATIEPGAFTIKI